MGSLAYNISCLDDQNGALPLPIQKATEEVLRAAEAAGHHISAVSWFNPASTPEHHVAGFKNKGGVAVDFMVYGNVAAQDWLDAYLWKHRSRLGLCWIISRRRIRSTSPGHSGSWEHYSGPSGHYDHTHANFGGLAGTNGYRKLTKVTYRPLLVPAPKPAPKPSKAPAATPGVGGQRTAMIPDRYTDAAVIYTSLVRPGASRSASVYHVQRALNGVLDGVDLTLTGDYDAATVVAARRYQGRLGDDELDGALGPKQIAALVAESHLTLTVKEKP